MAKKADKSAQYVPILVHVFRKYWARGIGEFEFHRDELVEAAEALGIERPDNLGDVIYSFKFRRDLPKDILRTAPKDKAWMIEGAGRSRYRFRLVELGGTTIAPRSGIAAIKIPDSTPEVIAAYALGDEQALLPAPRRRFIGSRRSRSEHPDKTYQWPKWPPHGRYARKCMGRERAQMGNGNSNG